MKPYSVDFRQKIIDVYNEGNISQRQARSTLLCPIELDPEITQTISRVQAQLLRLYERNAPPTQLNSQQLEALQELVNSNSDATLEELRYSVSRKRRYFN